MSVWLVEAHDGDVGIGASDLVGLDTRDVGDYELRRLDGVRRDQLVLGQQHVELAAEEEVDPSQQDRRHGGSVASP